MNRNLPFRKKKSLIGKLPWLFPRIVIKKHCGCASSNWEALRMGQAGKSWLLRSTFSMQYKVLYQEISSIALRYE